MQDLDTALLFSSYQSPYTPPCSILTFFQFLKYAKLITASGPLHLQTPLPGSLFPMTSHDWMYFIM